MTDSPTLAAIRARAKAMRGVKVPPAEMIDRDTLLVLVDELAAALERSRVALDDWLNIYASELCFKKRVAEARKRINEYGFLSYIASIQKDNRDALAKVTSGTGEGKS